MNPSKSKVLMVLEKSYYALVQGKYYQGDIEGERYHWTKGIPGSMQLMNDLKGGGEVKFIYYRTWDKKTKRGKYFYGSGTFDNEGLKIVKDDKNKVEYFADIENYSDFAIPVVPRESLRKKIWSGANRQPGIKKITEAIFTEIVGPGYRTKHLKDLTAVVGERNLENLLNGQISTDDLKDVESIKSLKHAVKTEVYKRTQKVIKDLKKYYKGVCQITGDKLTSAKLYGADVTEAHHIQYLCEGGAEADPSNIIIISPEWHRLLHKKNPKFDRKKIHFVFPDGKLLPVKFPRHLK